MSIIVRFFDFKKQKIREEFIGFFDCFQEAADIPDFEDSLTGKVLGKIVVSCLIKHGLSLKNLVAVGTDTGSVMASEEKGAVAEIKTHAKLAIHSPCLNHLVNLSVKAMCSKPEIAYYMNIVQEMYNFFRYPKRNELLQSNVKKNAHKQLARVCLTRWSSALSATTAIIKLIGAVIKSLNVASKWNDMNVRKSAHELLCQIDGKFIINLILIDLILQHINPLVVCLQKPRMMIHQAFELIRTTIEILHDLSTKRGFFENAYEQAEKMCLDLDISIYYNRKFDRKANMNLYQDSFKQSCEYFASDLLSRSSLKEESFALIEKVLLKKATIDDLAKISEAYCEIVDEEPDLMLKGEFATFEKLET